MNQGYKSHSPWYIFTCQLQFLALLLEGVGGLFVGLWIKEILGSWELLLRIVISFLVKLGHILPFLALIYYFLREGCVLSPVLIIYHLLTFRVQLSIYQFSSSMRPSLPFFQLKWWGMFYFNYFFFSCPTIEISSINFYSSINFLLINSAIRKFPMVWCNLLAPVFSPTIERGRECSFYCPLDKEILINWEFFLRSVISFQPKLDTPPPSHSLSVVILGSGRGCICMYLIRIIN